jgi:hypothetical protein
MCKHDAKTGNGEAGDSKKTHTKTHGVTRGKKRACDSSSQWSPRECYLATMRLLAKCQL